MTDGGGSVVLCDYGLARRKGRPWPACRAMSGKLPYQAPEIYDGRAERCDPSMDVFSMGSVLFIMLGGIPPFKTPHPQDQRYAKIQDGRLGELAELWGCSVQKNAVALVTAMLESCPSRRITVHGILNHPWVRDATA